VEAGPAVTLKPSKWRRLFRKRRRSPSLSSALSDSLSELSEDFSSNKPSLEDIRVMGHVQEIVLRSETPESGISSCASTVFSRKESVETLSPGMARDLFSDGALYVDALEGNEGDMQRFDTMKSVYVDAVDGEEEVEVKETMEVTVVAEVQDGITLRNRTHVDLPTITEDEGEGFFTEIKPDEFTPVSNVARKFLLLTFVILVVSAKSQQPVRIDSRWYNPTIEKSNIRVMEKSVQLLRSQNKSRNALKLRRAETNLSLRYISYCAF